MEIIKFIGLLSLTWLFVFGSEPVQFFKKYFNLHPDNPPKDLTRLILMKLINCALCSGFWIGGIYYLAVGSDSFILMACNTGICAELFARIINLLFNRVFNHL